ncbi:hypothetical protein GXW83_26370 [Streptacidiphilus sp. PB12-B1b]|uniref:DUF6299 family protein n=1 Tax=Streptacidiphilus sp. PB12-B1b TaxID=2705012 RepID=UPI0015FC48CF|nr:DUF6299 family protein [Streptacidiphilus sp. PB12-B1b]QMU78708.1 hypothetical protein GXW83_26370 [Streptacidiphilus sp. PB12-B1b]
MRGRLAVVGAVGVLVVWAAGPAGAEVGDTVSANPTGVIAKDGTVTLSGTYQCESSTGTVVSSTLVSGSTYSSIGGSAPAVCDGAEHTWQNTGKPFPAASAGPVTVEVSLVQLQWTPSSLIPQIDRLADQRQQVTLVPTAG